MNYPFIEEDTVPAHPSYPNPHIIEALCEVHLRHSATHPWKTSKPGAFFKAVQDTYPEIEPITQQGVQLIIGPDNLPQQQLLPPRISFRLKHRERPMLLQLSEQNFTINALRPYPGWSDVKSELKRVWPIVLAIVKPEAISRIGMRYINRIHRRGADEKPGYWLNSCEFIPAVLLDSGPEYQLRLQSRIGEYDRVVLTIAHDKSDRKEMHGALLFDIDRITERLFGSTWAALDPVVEALHEDIWRIFDAAKGEPSRSAAAGKTTMMLDNSRATSVQALLSTTAWAGSWPDDKIETEVESLTDLATTTAAGRVADLIGLIVDGSGMQRFYAIEYKNTNEAAIALLQRWIEEYGDDVDPDLGEQVQQLSFHRLSLQEQC